MALTYKQLSLLALEVPEQVETGTRTNVGFLHNFLEASLRISEF